MEASDPDPRPALRLASAVDEAQVRAEDESHWRVLADPADAESFSQSWLALQQHLLSGFRRGLVLLGSPGFGPFAPVAFHPAGVAPPSLLSAAQRTLVARRAGIERPDPPEAGAPTPLEGYLVSHPIEIDGQLHGAVVVEVSPRSAAELAAVARLLRWGAHWFDSLLHLESEPLGDGEADRLEAVLSLTASALEAGRFQSAATGFAGELALALESDRVALAFLDRGRVRLQALSHRSEFGRTSDLARCLEAAMGEAIDQRRAVVFPRAKRAPSGLHAHTELARRHGAAAICSVPLVHNGEICGAITLERNEKIPYDRDTLSLCEAVAAMVGPALELQRREDRWLLWKAVETARSQLQKLTGPHHVALKLAASLTVSLALFLLVARGDYRVTADAALEPSVLRASAAPFDGFVAASHAKAGDLVKQGASLADLDDRELALERTKWRSEYVQIEKQYLQALSKRDAAQSAILHASLAEARAELRRTEERLRQTQLRAPFDGVVVSGDLSQKIGSPVRRGETLFEVAPISNWRLVVKVDERDIAYVSPGQSGHLILTSLPDEALEFEVQTVTPVSSAEEGHNTFRVEAALQGAHPQLRPNAEGVAKIEIDRRGLFWIWTHKVLDWLRLAAWRWLP